MRGCTRILKFQSPYRARWSSRCLERPRMVIFDRWSARLSNPYQKVTLYPNFHLTLYQYLLPTNFSIEKSKIFSALRDEDQQRTKLLFAEFSEYTEIRNQFYQILNQPLQMDCLVGKFFGGQWLGKCGSFDGHKFVCLDKFYGDVITGNCLVI